MSRSWWSKFILLVAVTVVGGRFTSIRRSPTSISRKRSFRSSRRSIWASTFRAACTWFSAWTSTKSTKTCSSARARA